MRSKIVFIDSNLNDTNVLFNALNDETFGIIYDYNTSRNSILQQIDAAFSVKTIQRIAICCHEGVNQFLENGTFFDLDGSTNEVLKNSNTYFILDLLTSYNVSNIDFLACNSLKYDSWKKYFNLIESEVKGVTVGASEDETGNLKYGGNWVMENTGEQVDSIYFNEGLEYYKFLLTSRYQIIDPPASNRYVSHQHVTWDHYSFGKDKSLLSVTELSWATYQLHWGSFLNNGLNGYSAPTHYNIIVNGTHTDGDTGFFLEMSFNTGFVSGIVIKRRNDDTSTYTTSYRVKEYDGSSWNLVYPETPYTGTTDKFIGSVSTDDITLRKVSKFETPIETTKVRIYPTSCNKYFSGHFGIETYIPLLLQIFTITPSNITFENHGTINMTFSDDVKYTDISNSLIVDPSNAGIITNITGLGTDWTADFTPNYRLNLTDCRLKFKHDEYDIDTSSNTFNIDTTFEILDFSLTPSNLVDTDVSAILRVEFDKTVSSSSDFNITMDPSYIATLGTMSHVSGGFVWEGVLTRTPNMNKLGNKLDFDFSYNGVEVSANLVFDVVENSQLINKKWSLTNSDTINNVFTSTLQMSPNGLLMGFINGANVEIYRKSENWILDVSYIGHKFALTNNHIAIASDASLQIYDYSGNSWNIMNGGNIAYLNIIALSINVDGNVVAVSDNSVVKLFKNISNNWTHINTHIDASVNSLSLSPNGLKLGMGIGNVGEDFSSIVVEDVVVVDTTPPVITLIGNATVNHEINTTYNDAGAMANDNVDGDLTNNIVTVNNVNIAVLGPYNVTYNVADSKGNNAVEVVRLVNIVDTTNPVVTLNGDAEVTLNVGDTYTELGATATDNSLESLTVDISGQTVDTNTIGDYIVTYTATDSTGNSHQIERLVHIIAPTPSYTLRWTSDPATNLFDLLSNNLYNGITATNENTYDVIISGQTDSYLNGTYNFEYSGHASTTYNIKHALIYDGEYRSINGIYLDTPNILPVYGSQTGKYNRTQYDFSTTLYRGFTNNASSTYVNFTQTATNSNDYRGDYIEFTFPFKVKPIKIEWDARDEQYSPNEFVVLGSNDKISYDYLEVGNGKATVITCNISTVNKYSTFKVIVTKYNSYNYVCRQIKIYGDIYA